MSPVSCALCELARVPPLLLHHLSEDHNASMVYCSTKHENVVYAVFDGQLARSLCLNLSSSARILRTTVVPAVRGVRRNIDRSLVLCLDKGGLVHRNSASVSGRLHRCVGYTYYDRDPAQRLLLEAVLAAGRARRILTRMQAECALHGGARGNFFPRRVDVFGHRRCSTVCYSKRCVNGPTAESSVTVSTDATIRIMRRIKGQ